MKKRFHDISSAIKWLNQRGVVVNKSAKTISRPKLVGLGTWGAIDFLCNYHKFIVKGVVE